mmetsp:Transcript_4638/g.5972  ORF Transcript_4638/g.5972 Transcript_4638/m.5972 type:complete len:661 (-) Transcript_4638:116-2098(-)
MAIVSRSERGTDFALKATPSVVGPGSYEALNRSSVKPNFAGFGSSKTKSNSKSSTNPGPGSYLDASQSTLNITNSVSKAGSNSFTTSVSRLAPICPGSTPFQTSSSASCPGPGSYEFQSAVQIKKKKVIPKKPVISSRLVVAPNYNPPAVPTTLSKGPFVTGRGFKDVSTVIATDDQVQVKVQIEPKSSFPDSYSGLGQDTVGPALYNPRHKNVVPNLSAAQLSFSRSRSKRDMGLSVHTSSSMALDTPGPGTYEAPSSLCVAEKPPIQGLAGFNPGHEQKDAPIGRSSFFASSAPRVGIVGSGTVLPGGGLGPGSYVGSGGIGDTLMNDPEWHEKQYYQATAAFGSEAPRRPTFLAQAGKNSKPGPGQYGTRSDFDFEAAYTLSDRNVGFASTGARGCVPDAPELVVRTSKSAPGPGYYDIDAVDGIANGVDRIRKLSLGRHGKFGTSSERFKMYDLPPQLGGGMDGPKALNPGGGLGGSGGSMPGPGSYELNKSGFSDAPPLSRAPEGKRGQSGRLLRTHLGTYSRLPQPMQNQGLGADDLGGYTLKKGQPMSEDLPSSQYATGGQSLNKGGGAGIWARSAEARFNDKKILDKVIPETPGPSRYQNNSLVPKPRTNKSSLSKSHRFEAGPRTQEQGPGAYDTSQAWVKKSYNVNFVRK